MCPPSPLLRTLCPAAAQRLRLWRKEGKKHGCQCGHTSSSLVVAAFSQSPSFPSPSLLPFQSTKDGSVVRCAVAGQSPSTVRPMPTVRAALCKPLSCSDHGTMIFLLDMMPRHKLGVSHVLNCVRHMTFAQVSELITNCMLSARDSYLVNLGIKFVACRTLLRS